MASETDNRRMTVAEVAAQLHVEPKVVRGHIHRGRLNAVNVGGGRRPTWRIAPRDLAAFELRQQAKKVKASVHRRARHDDDSVLQLL